MMLQQNPMIPSLVAWTKLVLPFGHWVQTADYDESVKKKLQHSFNPEAMITSIHK